MVKIIFDTFDADSPPEAGDVTDLSLNALRRLALDGDEDARKELERRLADDRKGGRQDR